MIDKVISHYKVIDKLGEGGMGLLYLAEDLELNRKAVLKFLPPDVMNDPETNLRFKREAQSAGSLSHPNIVTIYDVGVHENKTFIAMEYVEGKTLRELIKSDELTIERITDISVQICEGLNEAHSKGITHRDIKPENILIDKKGKVKIVDFGLAKIKNVSRGITKQDSTVGTLKYMSPEQIRNQSVDNRSDIWSFGIILFEMITGKYPFKGEHDASLFYSIINQSPEPLARYKANISEGFQRIVDKALDKEVETRYQHIDDLLTDLRREKKESGEHRIDKRRTKKSKTKIVVIISAAAFLIFCFIIIIYLLNNPTKNIKPPKHTQLTFNGNIFIDSYTDFTQISPDGKYSSYVVNNGTIQSIYVKEIFGKLSYKIFDAKTIWCLRWSPDGNEIYFSASILDSDKSLLKVSRNFSGFIISKFGGKARPIDDWLWYGGWSPDGNSLALIFLNYDSVRIINRWTQERERIFKLNGDYTSFKDIDWSPKGDNFVCLTFNDKDKKYVLWTIKIDGTHQQKILESDKEILSPRWSADGKNVYYLQESKGTRDLIKVRISDGIPDDKPRIIISGLEAYGFSLSADNKKLVYTKHFSCSNLWKLSFDKWEKSYQQRKLTNGTSYYSGINISPDNKKLTFVNQGKVFVKSIDEGEMKQISSMDSECSSPSWNPNGKEIVFFSGLNIVIADIQEGIVQRKFKHIEFGSELYWSADSIIFYSKLQNYNFYILNIYTNEKRTFLKNDENTGWIYKPLISPNKERVAVYWNRWGDETLDGLWVISIDDSIQKQLMWKNIWPLEWSEDGKCIYAISFDNIPVEILKVSFSTGIIEERIKVPFDDVWEADITSDGKTLICNVGETNSDVWMIENFDPDVE